MRAKFEEGRYQERLRSGNLSPIVRDDKHPAPPHQPFCTRSQMIEYQNRQGRKVALVHQYLRPDGTVGASGKPDPKAIWTSRRYYYVSRKAD